MKISLNWLKDYIQLDEPIENICEVLTATGLEVEGVETFEEIEGSLQGVVIGEVMTCEQHPNADRLKKTTVDIGGDNVVPIVCGAPNVAAGQKVIVATVNSTLYPIESEAFKIKKAKIRGEVSEGMICAEDEIGIGKSHDGILILDTNLPNGTPASKYFNLETDVVIEIGLTPNRADAASHLGTARDLRAAFLRDLNELDVSDFNVDNNSLNIEVTIENEIACPRYSGVTLSGIEVKASPKWLQNRLKSIGLTPVNNIVDSTNYVLHSIGQPMHAFDADKIKGQRIVVKTVQEGTKFVTLDEKERELKSSDLMICDDSDGMCIAGVFGGVHSGVTESTKRVFLESAYFSPDYIRKTAMVHGLKTDASFRYERGTDPNATVVGLKLCSLLIQKLAGGEVTSEIIDIYPKPIEPTEVKLKYRNINRLIGKELSKNRIKEILFHLDIKISEESDEGFTCMVPAFRVDVQREADVIEEILRVYGYNNIELEEHYGTDTLASFPTPDKVKVQEKTGALLAANGYNEIITNSLTNPSYLNDTTIANKETQVQILNKLSEELGVMRQSLVFSGLEVIRYNINRKQKNLKFFEFGRSYHMIENDYEEFQYLSLYLSGKKTEENWSVESNNVDFHDISSTVHMILGKFMIQDMRSKPANNPVFEFGLDILDGDEKLVSFGLLNNAIVKKMEIVQPVFYAEFKWEKLLKYAGKKVLYKHVPKFPEVKRDLSLVIDKSITYDQINDLANKQDKGLIKKINVFSIYEGENIGKDKKSYALSFILQDEFKTLSDKQIDKTMNGLMRSFENELNAIIRK